jgi:hypothetical protein
MIAHRRDFRGDGIHQRVEIFLPSVGLGSSPETAWSMPPTYPSIGTDARASILS